MPCFLLSPGKLYRVSCFPLLRLSQGSKVTFWAIVCSKNVVGSCWHSSVLSHLLPTTWNLTVPGGAETERGRLLRPSDHVSHQHHSCPHLQEEQPIKSALTEPFGGPGTVPDSNFFFFANDSSIITALPWPSWEARKEIWNLREVKWLFSSPPAGKCQISDLNQV